MLLISSRRSERGVTGILQLEASRERALVRTSLSAKSSIPVAFCCETGTQTTWIAILPVLPSGMRACVSGMRFAPNWKKPICCAMMPK